MINRCGSCVHFHPSDHEVVRDRGYDGICAKMMFTKLKVSAGCELFARERRKNQFSPSMIPEGAVDRRSQNQRLQ
jgi:hypothetical protein